MLPPLSYKYLLIMVLAVLSILSASNCQAADPLPLAYRLKAYTLLQECNEKGVSIGKPLVTAPGGANFTLTQPQKLADGNYILEFWDWNPPLGIPEDLHEVTAGNFTGDGVAKTLTPKQLADIASSKYFQFNHDIATGKSRYFLISPVQLETSAVALVNRFSPTAGAIVMPFKFRPQTGDFTKDITFSGMGGMSWNVGRQTNHVVSGLVGLGITSVTLTPKNSTVTENRDQAAITVSLAMLHQWERLQIGLLVGTDVLGEGSASWKYNKKRWFAAGIGFNIFTPESTEVKDTGND